MLALTTLECQTDLERGPGPVNGQDPRAPGNSDAASAARLRDGSTDGSDGCSAPIAGRIMAGGDVFTAFKEINMFRTFRTVLAASAATLLTTSLALAQCAPADLRPTLTEAERTEIAAEVAATPYGIGRAFEATRGDTTIRLFGTMHTAREIPDAPWLQDAIRGADVLLVEASADEQAQLERTMMTDASLILDTTGGGAGNVLPPAEFETLVAGLAPMGMPPQAIAQMEPWFAGIMISMPACVLASMATGEAPLDGLIEDGAAASGSDVASLESAAETLRMFGSLSDETAIAMLRHGISTLDEAEAVHGTNVALYDEGKITEIWAFGKVYGRRFFDPADAQTEAMLEEMVDLVQSDLIGKRNARWIPVILDATQNGDVLVAAGALHMPGDLGLLRMLEAEGFTIERIVLPGEATE